MDAKTWFEYMKIYEEIVELFGGESVDEETGIVVRMDPAMIFEMYVDTCRHAGLPMDDEPEMPEDFMMPYNL